MFLTSASSRRNFAGFSKKFKSQVTFSIRAFASLNVDSNVKPKKISKILVANRGEIACRVMRSAKKLNIKTVAVYSEADKLAQHVKHADEAYCIGPAASSESYLNIENIIKACKDSGADAVHPGYGFLSENATFCDELDKNNIIFIGPGKKAIDAMGDKIHSKKLAQDAGVNVIGGTLDEMNSAEDVFAKAKEIGYPVMIKASAGGGGKGMRIAYNDSEAKSYFQMCKEEAMKFFKDDRIFVEKYIENPRHIEIQVLGDEHGNVVALPERECSLQRRNQKVAEEAPCWNLPADVRLAMQNQAIQLSKAVDYKSAGTVEFLVDSKFKFYFLEMNTRLQVEHPITEEISGVDLVEQMIRVAEGKPIGLKLIDGTFSLPFSGHAIESRVYAEDPFKGFLPSTGLLTTYEEPTGNAVRVDTGVVEGSEISMFYDPMISKLVVKGENRNEAIQRMINALDAYAIEGVGNNLTFLRALVAHKDFNEGNITTNFIQENYPKGFLGVNLDDKDSAKAAYAAFCLHLKKYVDAPFEKLFVELTSLPGDERHLFEVKISEEDKVEVVEVDVNLKPVKEKHSFEGWWNDESDESESSSVASVFVDDEHLSTHILQHDVLGCKFRFLGATFEAKVLSVAEAKLKKHMKEKPKIDYSKFVQSPMPGQLISVAVKAGDKVTVGQELCIVEAMKMQNVLRSEKEATVKSVTVNAGDTVEVDQILIEFE